MARGIARATALAGLWIWKWKGVIWKRRGPWSVVRSTPITVWTVHGPDGVCARQYKIELNNVQRAR